MMPEKTLIVAWDTLKKLVQQSFDNNCILIENKLYSDNRYSVITDLSEFSSKGRLPGNHLYHIVSEAWLTSPLQMQQVEKNGTVMFYIAQKTGGPTIDLFYHIQDTQSVRMAISYYSTYWNPITHSMERPAESLKSLFRTLVKNCDVLDSVN